MKCICDVRNVAGERSDLPTNTPEDFIPTESREDLRKICEIVLEKGTPWNEISFGFSQEVLSRVLEMITGNDHEVLFVRALPLYFSFSSYKSFLKVMQGKHGLQWIFTR